MAAIDVVNVTGVEERRAVGGEAQRLERAFAGAQLDRPRRPAVRGHGVGADPLLRLLLEDQALSRPGDPLDRLERLPAGLAVPHLDAGVAGDRRDHEGESVPALERGPVETVGRLLIRVRPLTRASAVRGPRRPLPGGRRRRRDDPGEPRHRLLAIRRARTPDECDPLGIGRPRRARVEVDAWRGVRQLPGPGVVDPDQRVIVANADERELDPIRRPPRVAISPPRLDRREHRLVDRRGGPSPARGYHQDLPVPDQRDRAAVGREHRRPALDHPPRAGSAGPGGPDGPLRSPRVTARIGDPALPVGGAAPNERDDRTVIGNREIRQHHAVVRHEAGEPDRLPAGRRGGEDVAAPPLLGEPRDSVGLIGRDQLRGKARAHELIDRGFALGGGARDAKRRQDGPKPGPGRDSTHDALHGDGVLRVNVRLGRAGR